MALAPAPPTAICVVADQTICLDLRSDRYFSLRGAANEALNTLLAGRRPTDAQRALIDGLETRGILRGVRSRGAVRPIQRARRSILDEKPAAAGLAVYFGLLRALHDARRSLNLGLEFALGQAARLRQPEFRRTPDPLELSRIASAYRRASPLVHGPDDCVLRSLAMHIQLARRGLAAELVLGVALYPFRAHCWVQSGDLVLNDCIDTVRAFTPILCL